MELAIDFVVGAEGVDAVFDRAPLGDLINMIPGLQTTNPQQMSPNDVAILADHLRQHNPDAFGKAATEVGRKDPDLLQELLGNKALMLGAAALAAKLLSDRSRRRAA